MCVCVGMCVCHTTSNIREQFYSDSTVVLYSNTFVIVLYSKHKISDKYSIIVLVGDIVHISSYGC